MFGRKARTLNFSRATPQDIGAVLDRLGMTWTYDQDGDVRFRTRSSQQPWTEPVFYEFDPNSANFMLRGQFLEGKRIHQSDGTAIWDVPAQAHRPTDVAQKVVTVFLTPGHGGLRLQIHAAVAVTKPQPMHLRVVPSIEQIARIERGFPGFNGVEQTGPNGTKQAWMATLVKHNGATDEQFRGLIERASSVGLYMFDGPFTGWLNTNID